MSYKTYENYKDSGIGWIGEIPKDWGVCRVKNNFNIRSGDSPVKKEEGEYEIIGANGCIGLTDDFNIVKKHIVIGRVGAAGSVNITPEKAFVSDNALILDFDKNIVFNYAFYLFKALDLDSLINKNAQPLITATQVKNLFILNISKNEQSKIAGYLDKKTSEIDENIAKNKELISLLEEKKTALINQAVTKGLNPNVPMKDSGIEWIGEIPEHWEIRKLKNISDIIMGQSPNSEDVNEDGNGVLFMQGNAEFGDTYPNPTSFCSNPKKLSRKGDILMSVRAPVGELNLSDKVYCIGRGLCSIKATNINSMYLWYFLSNSKLYFDFYSNGSTFDAITVDALSNLFINLPTKSEQEKFVSHLNKEISKYDEIIRNVEKQIDLLEEYKTSLIHHAVTGKIDVRDEI